MDTIQNAWLFTRWALEFMLLPPLLLALAAVAVSLFFAVWRQRSFHRQLWKPRYWWVLTHLLFFPAAITVGMLCAVPLSSASSRNPNRIGTLCVDALLYASLASCAFWIWRMKGLRRFAGSLVALMELPILGALMIAGMSVTGDWL
jgi:hypothetical protein